MQRLVWISFSSPLIIGNSSSAANCLIWGSLHSFVFTSIFIQTWEISVHSFFNFIICTLLELLLSYKLSIISSFSSFSLFNFSFMTDLFLMQATYSLLDMSRYNNFNIIYSWHMSWHHLNSVQLPEKITPILIRSFSQLKTNYKDLSKGSIWLFINKCILFVL